jgi:hypothetical protein
MHRNEEETPISSSLFLVNYELLCTWKKRQGGSENI